MDKNTRQLLLRWQALQDGGGLKRVTSLARALWSIGLLLALFCGYAVVNRLDPILIAAVAAATGWIVAETNALRTRAAQWPIVKMYIDWKHVREDLGEEDRTRPQ